MQCIDLTTILKEIKKDKKDWFIKVKALMKTIRAAKPEERSKIISKASSQRLWKELKPYFEKASNKKCWYCESRQSRSDKAVDHFRPKGAIRDDSLGHVGYWWLAFEPGNYRYSCTFCNSKRKSDSTNGGKWDYFPLENDKRRLHPEKKTYMAEGALLIDPCDVNGPGWFWFDESGEISSKYTEEKNPGRYKRVKKSIELYHLDHPDLVEERLIIAGRISDLIDTGEDLEQQCDADQNTGAAGELKRVKQQLAEYIKSDAEYSACAKAVLLGHREKDWLMEVIQTAQA